MNTTILELPTELLKTANITPEEARRELAIRLYQLGRLNRKQAEELAGIAQSEAFSIWDKEQNNRFDLDSFLSWASHDLKTPLNSIIGFSKVVLKGIDGPINETQEKDLSTVFQAGQRMLALIGYLVEIARLNIGHTQLAREAVNLNEILLETTNRWKAQNPTFTLAVEVNVPDSRFNLDRAQIRQLISHLLTFASLRVSAGNVTLSASASDTSLQLRAQSFGTKKADTAEMDTAMLTFIIASLARLHGGEMQPPEETENGLLLTVTLPRYI
jgi:signal transduction histidine kinase